MADFVASIRALDAEAQARRARDFAKIVAPYGTLAAVVIDPTAFDALCSRLVVEPAAVGDECKSIVDRFEEEPEVPGFYAFGAVVAVYYASLAMQGESEAAINCAKRFLDLTGFADDAGESGLFDAAVRYLALPSPDDRRFIVARVEAHADSMR
jgi:hypothetical protein